MILYLGTDGVLVNWSFHVMLFILTHHVVMHVVFTDITHLLCLHDAGGTQSTKISLKCFCESYAAIASDPAIIVDLPPSNKPVDGCGILIDLSDKRRCQLFATWILKVINRCLTEGTLYVEGLVNSSFVHAACSLLCHGDAALHMVGHC